MKVNLNNFIYKNFIFILAFLYAIFLSNYSFDHSISQDRDAYINYVLNSKNIFISYYHEGGLKKLLSNEFLFLTLNIFLNLFYQPETVVKIIIFFSAFITSLLILRDNSKNLILLLLFLIFPAVLFKFIVHLRQGFAISIFLLGWFSLSKNWRWFFFILTPFLHSSFIFVLIVYIANQFFKKLNFHIDLKIIGITIIAIIISLTLEYMIFATGARQSQYGFPMVNVSGLGFLVWISFFTLYLLEGKHFIKKYSFEISIIVFYLTTYFLIGVSARVFESAVLVVLIAGLSLTAWRKQIFTIAFTLYLIIAMYLRLF